MSGDSRLEADTLPANRCSRAAKRTGVLVRVGAGLGVRALFAVTAIVFPVQVYLAMRAAEPYPAMMLPGFPGNPAHGDVLEVEKPVFRVQFSDGQAELVPFDSVLPGSPLDPLPIFKNAFPFNDFHVEPDTLAWLKAILAARYPGRTVSGVDVIWRKVILRPDETKPPTYDTVRTVHLDLQRGA
jgi:hypothetical protein